MKLLNSILIGSLIAITIPQNQVNLKDTDLRSNIIIRKDSHQSGNNNKLREEEKKKKETKEEKKERERKEQLERDERRYQKWRNFKSEPNKGDPKLIEIQNGYSIKTYPDYELIRPLRRVK